MRASVLSLTTLVGFTLACGGVGDQPADIGNPQTFTQDGLAFDYPGNWTATVDPPQDGILSVQLENPGNALVIVQSYPSGIRPDLDVATTTMVDAMVSSISGATGGLAEMQPPTITQGSRTIAGAPRDERIANFTLQMFGIDVPHEMHLYAVDDVLVFTNVADEDASYATPGFDQILDSMTIP